MLKDKIVHLSSIAGIIINKIITKTSETWTKSKECKICCHLKGEYNE